MVLAVGLPPDCRGGGEPHGAGPATTAADAAEAWFVDWAAESGPRFVHCKGHLHRGVGGRWRAAESGPRFVHCKGPRRVRRNRPTLAQLTESLAPMDRR